MATNAGQGGSEPSGWQKAILSPSAPRRWTPKRKAELLRVCDERARAAGLEVTQVSVGYAFGTDLSAEGLRSIAATAAAVAAVADPDEYAGLPETFGATPVEGLASPAMAGFSTERKVELALAVERAARSRPGVTQVENAVYSDSLGEAAIANSSGFSASYAATRAWAYASAFAGEGEDLMTGLGVGLARDPGALDPEAIGAEAGERALALVGASRAADAAPWCWTASWRRRSPASSARCSPPTRSSAGGRCSPVAWATRWPRPRSCWPMTEPTPRAPHPRRSTVRAPPHGARP